MSYIKAEDVLPQEVIALIQQYVDGVSIYIPRKAGSRRSWGCTTQYRAELAGRNAAIREAHTRGESVQALAAHWHLSEKTIQRILRTK